MRTSGSVAPESSGSGSGRSRYRVRTVPTVPRVSAIAMTDRLGDAVEMDRLEERHAHGRERRVATVARARGRDGDHVDDAAGPRAEHEHAVREVRGLIE